MRILLLVLLLLQEGKIFQLSLMFKQLHVGNKLKSRILFLKPCLEDHFSHLQMIIFRIIKMFLIITFLKYTFVELNSKLFEETIFFLTSIMIRWVFWWFFSWDVFFLVCLCLFGLSTIWGACPTIILNTW
jgi:hypothetical protein